MNLGNLKIGVRLAIGFGIVLLMLIAVAVLGLNRMHHLQNGIETITNVNDEKARIAVTMRATLNDRMIALRNIVLLKEAAEIQPEVERVKNGTRKFDDAEAQLNKMLTSGASEEEKSLMKKIREEANAAAPIMAKVTELGMANKNEEATQVLIKELRPVQFRWMDAMMTLANLEEKMSRQAADEAGQTYETAFRLIAGLSVAAILFGMAIAWFITRGITRPIEEAVILARTVAAGNLTSRIDVTSSDETGQLLKALKEMNDSLARMVSQVRSGADMIATASGEIASGNLDLSSRTEEQASSLEETASSMEELTSTVKQNGENARQANQLAQSASGVAVKGGEVVSQVVDTMSSINESANRIVDIIAVIDGIAFQTNILALNAAVEAARAGEQGRGFAVVASEVRTLAQRSASAAKEIKGLINDSVAKVEAGGKLVAAAGTTMDEIVGSVRRVTDIIAEIAAASREQEAGIEQINQAISEMDNVTQQNASLVEEASAASEALREQARELSSMVSTFKLDSAQQAAPQATAPAKATVRKLPKAQFSANTVARRSTSHKIANAASGNEWEEF